MVIWLLASYIKNWTEVLNIPFSVVKLQNVLDSTPFSWTLWVNWLDTGAVWPRFLTLIWWHTRLNRYCRWRFKALQIGSICPSITSPFSLPALLKPIPFHSVELSPVNLAFLSTFTNQFQPLQSITILLDYDILQHVYELVKQQF